MQNTPAETQITQLLQAARAGDHHASEQLLPLVYDELRRLAHGYMKSERPGQTIQATALVHDAYLRLVGAADVSWDSRAHFFGAAAQAMRRILVERARRRAGLRHGGGRRRVDFAEVVEFTADSGADDGSDVLALDELLPRLAAMDQRKHDVVMLKYFAGLSNDEAAAALGVSSATVRNDWTYSKAWLLRELRSAEARGA